MNGLKYIRKRCNLSIGEVADIIGVTRQAMSSWENGKKDIPQKRKEQLADFFGIESKYFGSISEEDRQALLEKAMFRCLKDGRETYSYKPHEDPIIPGRIIAHFLEDSDITLDEEYAAAQKREQETFDKISDIMKWSDRVECIKSRIVAINRGCCVYDMLTELMETMRNKDIGLKMSFYYEIVSVLKAMSIAYKTAGKDIFYAEFVANGSVDEGWIEHLSEQLKEHWGNKELAYEEMRSKRSKKPAEKSAGIVTETLTQSIDDMCAEAECANREKLKANPEMAKYTRQHLIK